MPYRMTFPEGMDTVLADAMWWKFNGAVEATVEQKQEHAMLRVKEFLIQIVREYRLNVETEVVIASIHDQINTDIAQVREAIVIEQME